MITSKIIEEIKNLKGYEDFQVASIEVNHNINEKSLARCVFQSREIAVKLNYSQVDDSGFDIYGYLYQTCRDWLVLKEIIIEPSAREIELPAERIATLEALYK